jgi:hypothetical protein
VSVPIIRLEVERMKYSILAAFAEHQGTLDADIVAAVEAYCEPENIRRIIGDGVKHTLDNVIREEVEKFYRYGKGREVVREALRQVLEAE